MNKSILLIAAAAAALTLASGDAPAQRDADARRTFGQVGRYQMVRASEHSLFVIDTATGQCWSRAPDGEWLDAGNPARPAARGQRRPQRREAKLELPEETVHMTVVQRQLREIPGSDGSVRVQLGDITEGQVLLSVVTEDGQHLLDTTSVSSGDQVEFSVGRQAYTIRVERLRNVLIGDDFAELAIAPQHQQREFRRRSE